MNDLLDYYAKHGAVVTGSSYFDDDSMMAQGGEAKEGSGEIVIYQSSDKSNQIEVRMEGDTVWLTQKQMAELFQKDSDTIGLHLKNIYKDGELSEKSTTEKSSVVQLEGNRRVNREVMMYNLIFLEQEGMMIEKISLPKVMVVIK